MFNNNLEKKTLAIKSWFKKKHLQSSRGMDSDASQCSFCFPIPVSGSYYLEQFLDYCLPSLLSPGNLPFLVTKGRVHLIITTTAAEQHIIASHPTWQMATQLVEVQFHIIHDLRSHIMNQAHNYGLQSCPNAYVFFLVADVIMAEQGLTHLFARLHPDVEGIQCVALRAELPKIRCALEQYRHQEVLSIPQQQLNMLSLQAIDATTYCRDIESPIFTNFPSILLQQEGDALCARFFHFHLMMIKNRPGFVIQSDETFDARFLGRVVTSPENVVTITDIQEFFIASTVPDFFAYPEESHRTGYVMPSNIRIAMVQVASWARECTSLEWNNFRTCKVILKKNNENPTHLLSEELVDDIDAMAWLLNYFITMNTSIEQKQHNQHINSSTIRYIVVDNLPIELSNQLPKSTTLLSVNGLSRMNGRPVVSLSDLLRTRTRVEAGTLFVLANSQSVMYLKKMLSTGIPTDAFYVADNTGVHLRSKSLSLLTASI